ncbi:MAG: hypothetical protein ACLQF1_19320 [Methyloceanibacter sp.]
MSSPQSDIDTDIARLSADLKRLKEENRRLGHINTQMLDALNYALPVLQGGLSPGSADFDAINLAVSKIQNARAEAEDDNWPGKLA